jgi:D-alanyl-D-alanine dipeptidase
MFLNRLFIPMLLVCLVAATALAEPTPLRLPDGFVSCESVIPDIRTDLRYATTHNFVGEKIDGYRRPQKKHKGRTGHPGRHVDHLRHHAKV